MRRFSASLFLPLKRFTIQQQRKADVRLEALSNVPRLRSVRFEETKTGTLAVNRCLLREPHRCKLYAVVAEMPL